MTTAGAQALVVVVVTRRTRRLPLLPELLTTRPDPPPLPERTVVTRRLMTRLVLTAPPEEADRDACPPAGLSITLTAPPPMIAPPQVQAQSCARAIRTDMDCSSVEGWPPSRPSPGNCLPPQSQQSAKESIKFNSINHEFGRMRKYSDGGPRHLMVNVP